MSFSLNEGLGNVCGEGDSCNEDYLVSPIVLQSPEKNDQFGSPNRPTFASQGVQVQYHATPNHGCQEGIVLVDLPGPKPHDDSSSPTSYLGYDH